MSIEHVDHIVDLRRHLVMIEARFPAEAEPMLRDVERSANPWGKPQAERAHWADGLGVRVLEPGDPAPELLYWVGCAASYDERARASAVSTVRLLQAAGVDFAILGPRESCTGDPARRMGNEYVFQSFAEQNVDTLNTQGVKRIVTSCPHCFNTLSNEYPDFGGSLRGVAPLGAPGRARPPGPDLAGPRRAEDHLPRLLLPGPPQRRPGRAPRAGGRGRPGGGDGPLGQAHVLLRSGRCAHVDGGAGQRHQRGAGAGGGRDGRRHAGRRLPLLHRHAGRRRAHQRAGAAGGGRGHPAGRVDRAAGRR